MVDGGAGTNTLNIDDQKDPFKGDVYTITSSTLDRSDATGSYGAATITYHNFRDVVINGGTSVNSSGDTGGDTYKLMSPANASPVSINAGSMDDVFQFADGAGIAGPIDGGGGINTLDYLKYTTGATVDLTNGTATGVPGGFRNIQKVLPESAIVHAAALQALMSDGDALALATLTDPSLLNDLAAGLLTGGGGAG